MTTLTALARPATLLHPGPIRRGLLFGFFGTLATGFSILFAISIAVAVLHAGKVMPGVRVAGVDLVGLDRANAETRLRAELPSLSTGELTLIVDGASVELPYQELGRGYRLGAMLDSAFAVGRSGNLVDDALARIRLLVRSTSIPALAGGDDPAALDRTAASIVARFAVEPVDATVTYDADDGFVVAAGTVGARLDPDELRGSLISALARPTTDVNPVSLSTISIAPDVTTDEARAAAERGDRMIAMPLSLRAGGESYPLEMQALAALISFQSTADEGYQPVVDESGLAALVEPLTAEVASEPTNAAFEWGPEGVTGVTPGADGLELNVADSVDSIVDALQARANGAVRRSAALAVTVTPPALSTAAAQAAAPQMRRLSTWTTYYVPGEGNYWNANIHIPAWDLDGMVLAPGEWFSFWDDIGPVTLERGYGYGGAIINGRSVPNGALAGGICSTSTTLFNAAMRSGLEIGERTNHSYYIERYPVGLDATVLKTDTWETDMTFRNDTANPIVIRSYTGNGWVRFDIWGVPDGRTVTLSSPVTSNHRAAIDTVVVNPNMAPGTSKRVEYPHNGFHAVVTRWVRDAQGDLIWENVWQSNYRTVNGEVQVGPTPAPDPSTPEPEPTDG